MRGLRAPFVLLDHGERGSLYRSPVGQVTARTPSEVGPAIAELDAALARGLHCAGYIGYEAGLALEPRLARLAALAAPGASPLLWFGLFAGREEVTMAALAASRPGAARTGAVGPAISRAEYGIGFAEAQRMIRAGDIYQINLTFPCHVPVEGDPLDLYALLRGRAGARHGGIVRTAGHWTLSFSPELFFESTGRRLTARPMKGTAPRFASPADDARAIAELASDPKQRAENLMIVDLLRNDIARISEAGSVRVARLFEVESYPTIHQLTSTVTARLNRGVTAERLLRALFPCGSITGAPKIRAMELIEQLETGPRGIYTGSIGAFSPDGSARFNVAIRTLSIGEGDDRALLGVGSGLVADSDEEAEWRECLQKAAFVDSAETTRMAG